MNKAQLISTLASTTNLTRRDADVAVNSIFNLIIEQLRQGDKFRSSALAALKFANVPHARAATP